MTTKITSLQEYKDAYAKSVKDPEQFWKEIAETFTWQKPFDSVLNWNFDEPNVKWFEGGKLNIT